MTIEYFPSTIRNPIGLIPRDLAEIIEDEFQAGYSQTAPAATGIPKEFELAYKVPTDEYLDFVEFYRARHGGAEEFFWQWPLDGFGLPGYGGIGGEEDPTGFDTHPLARDVAIGEGPFFLVKFKGQPEHGYDQAHPGWWNIKMTLREQEI